MELSNYYESLSRDEKLTFVKNICTVCSINESAVRHFVYKVRKVPAKHCLKIAALTNNKVSAYDLRPDIFPKHYNK